MVGLTLCKLGDERSDNCKKAEEDEALAHMTTATKSRERRRSYDLDLTTTHIIIGQNVFNGFKYSEPVSR